ncbi:MAG TPA: ABC transporter ATP-binding protein [Planctomycetota bacterium]|nr:ABC transporter ATP-binding protein [Planctomycetota bacterium]
MSPAPAAAIAPPAARAGRRAPAELRLDRVSRWYGDVLALDAVDLVLGAGVTGLLGPNGAGKSTLIRLIVGLASPGDGHVLLDGATVRNNLDALARIGYVADGDGLYEELTARRFLTDQARLRGFAGAAAGARAEECLVRVGLEDAIDRRTGGFSKGMRQRLKLAQALLHDPDVLVLDEPLTGLDPVMRRDFIRIVRELGDEGVTVLVSSHVLHEVEAMTNGIVLLHHGQVLAEGTVGDIRDLLDKHARRIRVLTDRPRDLARELLAHDDLLSGLEMTEGGVILETLRPDRTCTQLQQLAARGQSRIFAVDPLDEDLASVFTYLVD